MHLGKGFCACDFMQGKKGFQHFVRKETLQSGLSTACMKIKNKQIHLVTLNNAVLIKGTTSGLGCSKLR